MRAAINEALRVISKDPQNFDMETLVAMYELRQGLEDRGVPVEMVVYKGFGHGINKPKSQRAVMWHNLVWFNHYLWGDELPDLWEPEVPEKEKKE